MSDNTREVALVGFEIAAQLLFPGAGGTMANFARACGNIAISRAQKILIDEIKKGNIDKLSDKDKEKLIPVGYQFYTAVMTGSSERNLRILAKLMSGMVDNTDINPDKYSIISHAIRDLSGHDLVILSCYARYVRENISDKVKHINEFIDNEAARIDEYFKDKNNIRSSKAILSSRGWIIPENDIWDVGNSYQPSKLVDNIIDLDILSTIKETPR